ncbi:MAG: hypothetical protein ACYC7A_19165 [Thermoanaerobaculia bacterium]
MKWIKRLGLTLVATAVAALVAFYGYAHRLASRAWDAPLPPITADVSAAGVVRGEAIFSATCAGCHVNQASGRFSGGPLADLPKFLGSFHAANLTAHPSKVSGVGAMLFTAAGAFAPHDIPMALS